MTPSVLISRLLPSVKLNNSRRFWGWLNAIANQVDTDRIQAVGPDRAAAEWLLRCGAAVKWKDHSSYLKDYNSIHSSPGTKFIQEIDATDSSISSIGFPHLKGLKYLDKMVIRKDPYLDDKALLMLEQVAESLKHLEIISCGNITDLGIKSLVNLKNLQVLVFADIPFVESKTGCLSVLKNGLPSCNIDWTDCD